MVSVWPLQWVLMQYNSRSFRHFSYSVLFISGLHCQNAPLDAVQTRGTYQIVDEILKLKVLATFINTLHLGNTRAALSFTTCLSKTDLLIVTLDRHHFAGSHDLA